MYSLKIIKINLETSIEETLQFTGNKEFLEEIHTKYMKNFRGTTTSNLGFSSIEDIDYFCACGVIKDTPILITWIQYELTNTN
jgi:hypothetical protein